MLYMHDYGGPVGFRLVTSAPDRVRGLVVQNVTFAHVWETAGGKLTSFVTYTATAELRAVMRV